MWYRVYQILWQGVDLLFPPLCGGCHRKGERWCSSCQGQVEVLDGSLCPVCGNPQQSSEPCKNCRLNNPRYEKLRSWSVFKGPIREALHQLKYKKNLGLGESLSRPMVSLLNRQKWAVDLIVPVPLSKLRLQQRGYNQAELLAWPVAMATRLHYSKNALIRIKESRSQVGLSFRDRRSNVAEAFWADSRIVSDRRILLIDDVTTTGATIESCTSALLQSGARQVYAMTLARAVLGVAEAGQV